MKKTLIFLSVHILVQLSLYAQDTPQIDIGGALRFNYNLSSWKPEQVARGGDFGFDLFRINAKAQYKGVKMDAEYRLYSEDFGGGMLKQGWIGYDFNSKTELQIGLTQVPFGITQYNSHSWFFSLNYYIGLEDDHDMGVKFSHRGQHFEYDIAFFKNAEELRFGNLSDVSDSRYSYDIASKDTDGDGTPDFRNKEVNQFNAKAIYKFRSNNVLQHRIGISGQYGGMLNLDTKKTGNRYALAAHYELDVHKFNIKAQITHQKINPKHPKDTPSGKVAMTAYGYPYFIASKMTTYTLGASYAIPIKWRPISNIMIYNDFGIGDKMKREFNNTYMNVLGALVTAGQVYTYIDLAMGKNMPWLNADFDNSLADGSHVSQEWETRFNINIGYYF